MPDQTFVLVAEDEELVRLVIVQALLDEGFEVMEAEHAEAALIVLGSHATRIHVLFTDIQMPGTMDGLALAHHTSKHWPWTSCSLPPPDPNRTARHFPRKADLWGSHIGTAMSLAIFASWRRRLKATHQKLALQGSPACGRDIVPSTRSRLRRSVNKARTYRRCCGRQGPIIRPAASTT
jgi:Response regulator receiver domain